MNSPHVSIVILNWNASQETVKCLDSVHQLAYDNLSIVIVDNGSTDDSLSRIREHAKEHTRSFRHQDPMRSEPGEAGYVELSWAEIVTGAQGKNPDPVRRSYMTAILNDKNLGYAGGNNAGIVYSVEVLRADFVLILNNDAIVDKYMLGELVKLLSTDRRIGIVGPKILYRDLQNGHEIINSAGGMMDFWRGLVRNIGFGEIDDGRFDCTYDVDCLMGACLLLRSEVFRDVGKFPDQYFLYWEDNYLCQKARLAGYRVVYDGCTSIRHKAFSLSESPDSTRTFFYARNRMLFMREFATTTQLTFFLIYSLSLRLWIEACENLIEARHTKVALSYLRGALEGLFFSWRI